MFKSQERDQKTKTSNENFSCRMQLIKTTNAELTLCMIKRAFLLIIYLNFVHLILITIVTITKLKRY